MIAIAQKKKKLILYWECQQYEEIKSTGHIWNACQVCAISAIFRPSEQQRNVAEHLLFLCFARGLLEMP